MYRRTEACKFCGRYNHHFEDCHYKHYHLEQIHRKKDGGLKKIYSSNKTQSYREISPETSKRTYKKGTISSERQTRQRSRTPTPSRSKTPPKIEDIKTQGR